MTQHSLESDVVWTPVAETDDETGLTVDEAYALLAGVGPQTSTAKLPLVAAANEGHTGAMLALVPSDADAERLAVAGGEAVDQLHLTLLFLGEAADVSDDARAAIVETARRYAERAGGPLRAEAFSLNIFNPGGSADGEREPCVVLGVGNDGGPALAELHDNLVRALGGMDNFQLVEQHTPWAPHVTLVYTDDYSKIAKLANRTGPITFDRLRVAFGDDVTDIPLETRLSAKVTVNTGR